jgi:cell division protein FtsB
MTEQQTELHRFFSEKAKHLQNEIDWEIKKIGGEEMLISREDLIHWVYYARRQVETYHTICRMLEDKAENADTEKILRELRETAASDRKEIAKIERRQEEERKALAELKKEAVYYWKVLEVLKA